MGPTPSIKTDVMGSHVSIQTLAAELLERHERPEDRYEVAAILESMGYNDERATHQFGVEDVFELAHELWMRIEGDISFVSFSNAEKKPFWLLTKEMIRSFLRGLIFAFPMGVSVLSMLTLQYSLWSYVNMTLEQATSIAIGTILSFITVGGFTQAIARRGFFYIIQGYYNLAKKNTFQFIIYGFIFCLLISFLLLGVNFIFNLYPYRMVFTLFLYFFFLNAIWLSVTVMYILRKEIVFTGLIILGIGLVFFLFQVCHVDILISQIISLCLVSLISIGLVLFYFYREEKKAGLTINLKLPRLSMTFYSVAPYFFYGFLYFSFLFVDRVNAWSTNETFMPYVVWFRGDYEVGLDFAILTLILPMGVSEVIVTKLMYDLESSQKAYLMTHGDKLSHQLSRSYRNMSLGMVATGLVSAGAVYLFTLYYNRLSVMITEQNLLSSSVTQFVLLVGVIAYVILSICLMNAVILFALSQPSQVIRAILPALGLNFLAGFLLTRWFGYQYAVIGLLLGSIYLVWMSTRAVKNVLKKIDYYLYAAS